MPTRPTTIVSLLGVQLDAGWQGRTDERRWESWRPTVSLFQHDDLDPERLVLLADPKHGRLAEVVAEDVRSVSPNTTVERVPLSTSNPWDFAEVYGALRDFADARAIDPEREDVLVHMTTGTHVAQICLFLLVESGHLPGRLIQSSPPRRERTRDVQGSYAVIDLDLSRYDRLAARFEEERREGVDLLKAGIETRNAAFNALMDRVERVALHSADPILLAGPTGVGKTQLARRIYELKSRQMQGKGTGRLVEVNCATLRGDQAMSALFGHAKGAFTGAVEARDGLLLAADGGVLFLDEIGELGLDEQAMLLRAIEEKTFLPVGSDAPASSSFGLIAGTNRDLAAAVRAGRFREDLLARIDLWTFELPSLKERSEDIEPNLEHELARLARERGRRVTMSREARSAFLRFAADPASSWRANFRDFGAAVTRMATLAEGGRITREVADEESERLRRAWSRLDGDGMEVPRGGGLVEEVLGAEAATDLDRFDRVQLEDVLGVCRRSRTMSDAGRTLFAASRGRRTSTNDADRLRKYLARFGLKFIDVAAAP
ncbi:MAG: RNA repair transcriptional activator RtcR [Planctomycetota bacterium]